MFRPIRQLELWFWGALPCLLALVLSIFCLSPLHMGGLNHFMPLLPLAVVFYSGLLHPRDMPYWFVFALGLAMDASTGTPMGLTSLLNLFFLIFLHTQHKYIIKEGFMIKWFYFALILAACGVLNWLLLFMYHARPQAVMPALLQMVLTVCCYPLIHKLMDVVYEHIHQRRWRILHSR